VQARRTSNCVLDWVFSRWFHWIARLQSQRACCASYVSEYVHKLYPTKYPDREVVFSGVRLSDEIITFPRQQDVIKAASPIIVSVGRLMPEKGHRILIEAATKLRRLRQDNWQILIAGDGSELEPLHHLVESLDLQDKVKLLGVVQWGPDLFELLDRARVFVLPSLTEGMPRALIEAMARGLPALASNTGGIRELLAPEDLVPPGDADALAERLDVVLDDFVQLARMSQQNFTKALEYKPEIMQQKKFEFWHNLQQYSSNN
jgi:phosphatidylinositol alpha-1,6-mannosyltransferase